MTKQFLDLMAQMPSVQQFVRNITGEIAEGRSVAVLLPTTTDVEWLWSLINAEMWRRFAIEQVTVPDLSEPDGPAAAIGEALHVTWPSSSAPRDIASLLASEGMPDVVMLDGICELGDQDQKSWLRFLRQWAQLSQNLTGQPAPPRFCVLIYAAQFAAEIESDVRLAIHWWWGFPSVLELKLLYRLAGTGVSKRGPSVEWQEHLLPAIAGTDIELLERLCSVNTTNIEQIVRCLEELAQERGWTKETLRNWGAEAHFVTDGNRHRDFRESPPGTVRALWAHGVAHATEEHGVELHAAALYVLEDRAGFQHRLWRGQAELLLPTLDGIRLNVCTYLTRLYGPDWPVRWYQPWRPEDEAAVRENPLACEWGYLDWLIRNASALNQERRWLPLVSPAARIRNTVAHYRTVSSREYEQVLGQYWRFVDETSQETR